MTFSHQNCQFYEYMNNLFTLVVLDLSTSNNLTTQNPHFCKTLVWPLYFKGLKFYNIIEIAYHTQKFKLIFKLKTLNNL